MPQAREPLCLQQRLSQIGGKLQVLGCGGKRVLSQLERYRPVGGLALALPVALSQFVVLAPCFLDFVEDE